MLWGPSYTVIEHTSVMSVSYTQSFTAPRQHVPLVFEQRKLADL